jgi:hypothetical protein
VLAIAAYAVAATLDLMDLQLVAPDEFAGAWVDAGGRTVPDADPFVMSVHKGEEHCGAQRATFLFMSWPPGTKINAGVPVGGPKVRQYVRDPEGVVSAKLSGSFDDSASLPEDAHPVGFQRGEWRLFISPAEADRFIFLVGPENTERWPRATPPIGCA